ncbi:MAG TPA: PKD domain-containing protein, partial [Methanolinea sp.]|nr:PKD domain-containing protein [Methanolinea sp.]
TVSDGSLSDSETITITVKKVNLVPVAKFSYTPEEIYIGNEVQFIDSSNDPDGSIDFWSWDFGDGETSAEQNPVHIYTEAANYIVKLTVTDNDGGSATMDVEIEVLSSNHAPVFDPIADQVVDEGETVEFTLTATDPDGDELTIEADSLPGGASFNGATFTWVTDYTQGGSYNVMFTVSDGSLTDTIIVGIVVNEVAPQEAIENLEDYIVNLNLDMGITNSLTAKLGAAISSLDRGNENAALNQLNAFINSVEAQRGKKLTNEQADALILEVNRIISGI